MRTTLKPCLDEILYTYIPKRIPKRYKGLPIKIALCFGGDIKGTVKENVDDYIDAHTKEGEIEFAEWNGDYIVGLIADGILRESIFPKDLQGDFRKALAFVDDSSVCVTHFQCVLSKLASQSFKTKKERLTAIRQIYLALWNIYVWGREANNLEAAYICGERCVLWAWELCKDHIGNNRPPAVALSEVLDKFVALNHSIRSVYIDTHVAPYCAAEDGLASAVFSRSNLDINLKLFYVLGKTAMHGMWLLLFKQRYSDENNQDLAAVFEEQIEETAKLVEQMVSLNPVFNSPIRDDHAIEITLACMFLGHSGHHHFVPNWITQIFSSCRFSFISSNRYPCVHREYFELAVHPIDDEDYKKDSTNGSVLYPILAIWCAVFRDEEMIKQIANFKQEQMVHSTWQIWLPGADTEEHLYRNSASHGASFSDLDFDRGGKALLEQINTEINASENFQNLSVMQKGMWPMVLMACRHHRLPIPPQYWYVNFAANNESGE